MPKQYFYVSISILLWGTIATDSKLFLSGLDPYFILFYSSFFATVALVIYNAKRIKEQARTTKPLTIFNMIVIGSLGIFFYNYFLQRGIAILPAQIAFVINYLWPAFIILFSTFILRERATAGKLIAVTFSFLGVAVVATNGSISNLMGGNTAGVIFCIMAAVCYGLYTPLNKRAQYDKNFALVIAYGSATIMAFIVTMAGGHLTLPTGMQLIGLIEYGVGTGAIAYIFWVKAMDIGNTAILSNLAYMTPIVSLVFTHFFLGESVTIYSVTGLLLIILGIIIQSRVQNRTQLK